MDKVNGMIKMEHFVKKVLLKMILLQKVNSMIKMEYFGKKVLLQMINYMEMIVKNITKMVQHQNVSVVLIMVNL